MGDRLTDVLVPLLEKVTPGPWIWRWKSESLHAQGEGSIQYGETILAPSYDYDTGLSSNISEADAELIALAPTLARRVVELESRLEAAEKVAASADQIIIAHRANYTGPDAERNKRGEIRGAMRAISKALAAYRTTEAANG